MSNERETKKLLGFKEAMERRVVELEQELDNLKTAMEEVDKLIVNTGFRTFKTPEPVEEEQTQKADEQKQVNDEEDEETISITSKDGTILGTMQIEDHVIQFKPSGEFNFTTDIPPFQSFLIERVLDNMKETDQKRTTNGELDPEEILSYEVNEQAGKILALKISNYGGERRLREINSSLRWTFDKMYDKLTQG
ncbi:hypothetical protein GF326_03860 [Candidatus Bathyarchaeota archaeon]|nr:hypothetical protein [Candidatus Bathyarchaeota archaeon]